MKFNLPSQVNIALNLLSEGGFEGYVVGGAVRDMVSDITPHDFDIATNAKPEETMEIFASYTVIPTGLKHGTVTVVIDHMHLEITTYRIDGQYSDNRRPDTVTFSSSIKDDLSRRDFTVNALAYNPAQGIVDHFGGIDDIKNKIIRCVGNPDQRFAEDALRIMRALRFSSQTGFDIEENTKQSIKRNKELLKNIAVERIYVELCKLLCGQNVEKILYGYPDVLGVVIPEILPCVGFNQNNRHHIYDVWQHTVVAISSSPKELIIRLTLLLHDIGKPSTYTTDKKGEGHFYGHGNVSCNLAKEILARLKVDNKTTERVLTLIKYHDLQLTPNEKMIRRWLNKIGKDNMLMLLSIKRADNLAQSPQYSRQKQLDELDVAINSVLEKNECYSLDQLKIKGNDIIALGIKEGSQIGTILNKLLQEVIEGNIENHRETLIDYIKEQQNHGV